MMYFILYFLVPTALQIFLSLGRCTLAELYFCFCGSSLCYFLLSTNYFFMLVLENDISHFYFSIPPPPWYITTVFAV